MSDAIRPLIGAWLGALIVSGCAATAAPPGGIVVVEPAVGRIDASTSVELLEDTSARWTLRDVTSSRLASQFRPVRTPIPNEGLSASAFWVRLRLRNPSAGPQRRLLEVARSTLDSVELFPREEGRGRVLRFERYAPFDDRPFPHRNAMFPIELEAGATHTLHLRLASHSELYFPVRIWSERALVRRDRNDYLVLGLSYGAVALLAIYQLAFFVRSRDRESLYIGLYFGALGVWLWLVDGLPYESLGSLASRWRNWPYLLCGAVIFLFALIHTRTVLDTARRMPRADIALRAAFVVLAVWFAVGAFAPWRVLNQFTTLIWIVLYPGVLVAGIVALRRGHRPARWFVVIWGAWVVGALMAALGITGVVHFPDMEILNPFRLIAIVQAVFLSFAAADHVRELTREQAQARAFAAAQSRIIEAEQQAVVGRLVAGVLHEVNTPLGAMRSSVESIGKTFERCRELAVAHGGDDNPEAAKALRAIGIGEKLADLLRDSSTRISSVLGDLKRFVSLDEAERGTLDVREGLDGALQLLGHAMGDRIAIERKYAEQPCLVDCHAARVNQAFLNVLRNAVDAIEREGSIRVTVTRDAQSVLVEITDSGRGIAAAELARVFDLAFTRTGERVRLKLGLPTAKRTIDELGGTIEITSAEGDGTTVRIRLPRSRPAGAQHEPE